MALNATEVLGTNELIGVKVNPRGLGKAIMGGGVNSGGGGGLAGLAIKAVADAAIQTKFENDAGKQREAAVESSAPSFPKIAWLALTDEDLVLVEVDARTTLKFTGAVLAQEPRSNVQLVEVGKSKPLIAAPITVTFADGRRWIFEVPAGSKGNAKELAAAFA